jgi:O-antigen/teichoic acid export membrane protein
MVEASTAETAETAETANRARRLRLRQGALITAGSALVLLIVMFTTKWYGVDEIPGRVATRTQVSHAANAWHALTIVRWLMLATIVVAVGSVLLHGSQRSHGSKTNTGALVAVLGSITAAVLIYRVLIDLPSAGSVVDQKLGAIIGLLAAIGIAFGGYESMLEERDRARRGAHSSRPPRQTASREPER